MAFEGGAPFEKKTEDASLYFKPYYLFTNEEKEEDPLAREYGALVNPMLYYIAMCLGDTGDISVCKPAFDLSYEFQGYTPDEFGMLLARQAVKRFLKSQSIIDAELQKILNNIIEKTADLEPFSIAAMTTTVKAEAAVVGIDASAVFPEDTVPLRRFSCP